MLLAVLTGRSDLCIAGVFGAGKTRSLAILLIALQCELTDFTAIVFTKENVAAKALGDQISDFDPPARSAFGRLFGRIEEGKGDAYTPPRLMYPEMTGTESLKLTKQILIATGGSATAKLSMRYSTFNAWLSRIWIAFMDENQQYGGYHEVASLAGIRQPALLVFVGDHRETPCGLSKGPGADNRNKLLQHPLGLRALNKRGDYVPPVRFLNLVERLCHTDGSDLAALLDTGTDMHSGPWITIPRDDRVPHSLVRLLGAYTMSRIDLRSALNAAALAILVTATSPEEFARGPNPLS